MFVKCVIKNSLTSSSETSVKTGFKCLLTIGIRFFPSIRKSVFFKYTTEHFKGTGKALTVVYNFS
jgi:hypothetical protein